MNHGLRASGLASLNWGAFKIAVLYTLVGGLWILFSDQLVGTLTQNSSLLMQYSTLKGWGYVVVTGFLLYWLIHRDTAALREREELLRRYQLLAEHTRDMILFMRRDDGRILEANTAAVNAYGYSRDELLSLSIDELRAPETRALTGNLMATADTGGSLFETIHRRKDGSTFPVEVSSQGATIGGVRTLISVIRDIGERQRAQETIRREEELLRLTGEMAQVGGWEFDPATGKGTWTAEVARIHDLDPEIVPNVELGLGFYVGESRTRIVQAVKDASECGTPYDLELELVSAQNNHKWVRTIGLPVKQGDRVVQVKGIFQDITARKQVENEIRRLNAELEQRVTERTAQLAAANQELEAFTYSVSHDLRAPLRAIDGFSRIILQRYADKLDAEGQRLFNIVRTNVQSMDQLITDLLALSRVTRTELVRSRLDMTALVHSVYEQIAGPEAQKEFSLAIAPLPETYGDPTMIRQVWSNLLSNALKYTRPKPERHIEVGSYVQGGMDVYFVKDNGVGFDPAYAHKLFGIFQRLHRATDFEGSGVGLAIVQRIVHRHGGQVWAEGEPDRGATFYFSLPSGRPEES